jgi:inhibitor of KinA sporulation pathway (predicted exonuclease)
MGKKMSNVISLAPKGLLKDAGLMLSRLNSEGPASRANLEKNSGAIEGLDVTRLLEDMNYVSREKGVIKLNYPVFAAEDSKVIEQLGNLVSPLITKAFHHHCAKLQESLRNTSPIRNKVEFNEVLNDAWHWILAQTNRILAEKGLFYDPPKRRAGEARYIAWMSEFHFHFP